MHRPRPFALERYFASREHLATHHLSPSDCESLRVEDLLSLAGSPAREALLELPLGYTESPGSAALRRRVAGLYASISAHQVLIAAPQECIYLLMHAVLSPGDKVVVISPAYQSLHELPRSIGCRVTPWPVHDEGTTWRVDIDHLADLVDSTTRLVVVNSPHNPTGLVLTAGERRSLVDILRRNGTLLFSDEMYRGLEYDPTAPGGSLVDEYENTIALAGLSKSYGLPGLRIGWLASRREDLLSHMAQLKDYTTICSSAPGELLATVAIEHGSEIIHRNLEIVKANVAVARRFFDAHLQLLRLNTGSGGSVLLPRFTGEVSAAQIAEELMHEQGLLMVPGELFGMKQQYFRLGLGRQGLPAALGVFITHVTREL